jgi:hypothetical protein
MSVKWLTNPAFCVLPFIQKFYDLDNQSRLCCHSSTPINDLSSADINHYDYLGIHLT